MSISLFQQEEQKLWILFLHNNKNHGKRKTEKKKILVLRLILVLVARWKIKPAILGKGRRANTNPSGGLFNLFSFLEKKKSRVRLYLKQGKIILVKEQGHKTPLSHIYCHLRKVAAIPNYEK